MKHEQQMAAGYDIQNAFHASDCGCWIDGAYGRKGPRLCEKMLDILSDRLPESYYAALPDISEDMEFEECEEYVSDATVILGTYTDSGLTWLWEAGDLILVDDSLNPERDY